MHTGSLSRPQNRAKIPRIFDAVENKKQCRLSFPCRYCQNIIKKSVLTGRRNRYDTLV